MSRRRNVSLMIGVALALLVFTALPGYAALFPRAAAQTEGIAWVVAGDLQSEVSTCGDWNNACDATTMEDSNADGVYRFVTSTLPVGTYEYKIVEYNNWDNAFPANNVQLPSLGGEVRWYFEPGPNRLMDNMNQCIATVAGSLQSEIGGGDWDPSNLRTLMWQEAPDSLWYATTETIPAGDYEYKVARDEAWDVSYPPNNVSLSLSESTEVTFRWNCATHEVQDSVNNAQGDEDIAQPAIQKPIQDEVFYFVLPDRFENGDPSNDTAGIPGDRLDHGFDVTDKGFFHGGDFAGLMNRLDYLEELGISSLWLTPVFKNNPVQGSGSDVSAGYHGYWITDFTQTDLHLGSNDELSALVSEVHGRSVKLFFDIITNHTADIIQYEEGQYSYITQGNRSLPGCRGQPLRRSGLRGN